MPHFSRSLCWFRRDLRLADHAALFHALKQSAEVHCVFVFDTDILDALPNKRDRRVEFILRCVEELDALLREHGSALHILHGAATVEIPKLARELQAEAVFYNHDVEPAAIARDALIADALQQQNCAFFDFKDQVIFERDEVLTGAGKPFSVFTPYKNAWLKKVNDFYLRAYPTERYFSKLAQLSPQPIPTLQQLGFEPTNLAQMAMPTGVSGAEKLFADFATRMDRYKEARDFPALKGVSYLSTHLRFGTISIRRLAAQAFYHGGAGAETWLSELIWREFYQMLLSHHPRLAHGVTFKPVFNQLPFSNDAEKFAAWCDARTGFPLVDAAMRQINQTGFMHNRLRMIVASFLVKDLHVDWRWGERYFAENLLDFDLTANNGGWQWAASTGCDAQPWFRIFNPVTQSERFDPQGKFIRRYLPELANCSDKYIHAPWLMPLAEQQRCGVRVGEHYPAPIVDHAVARVKTLALFKAATGETSAN